MLQGVVRVIEKLALKGVDRWAKLMKNLYHDSRSRLNKDIISVAYLTMIKKIEKCIKEVDSHTFIFHGFVSVFVHNLVMLWFTSLLWTAAISLSIMFSKEEFIAFAVSIHGIKWLENVQSLRYVLSSRVVVLIKICTIYLDHSLEYYGGMRVWRCYRRGFGE